MIKKLLQLTLISTMLLSYEIQLGNTKTVEKKNTKIKQQVPLIRDNAKETVYDASTGLTWQDNIDTKTIRKNRYDAKQYCRYLVFAGHKDWYLPRKKELLSIVDKKKYNPAIRDGFKNIVAAQYWTSSPNLSDIITAVNVDFKNGQSYKNTRYGNAYVRCVRGNYNTLI